MLCVVLLLNFSHIQKTYSVAYMSVVFNTILVVIVLT